MTEAEWLMCADPSPMLVLLHGRTSDRRLRLFTVSCCRRLLHLSTDARHRDAVEVAERYADGRATLAELRDARGTIGSSHISAVLSHAASMMAGHAAEWATKGSILTRSEAEEHGIQSHILRDIFGNPFRPVTFDPNWRTTTAIQLAQQMYDSRDFSAMPILADALQEAGCDHADILDHCRGPGSHVRGCWVVDLVLGKS